MLSSKNKSVIKRNGACVSFDSSKIEAAIHKAFYAEYASINFEHEQAIKKIAVKIAERESPIHIEEIQDWVERELMAAGFCQVAKRYILYREERQRARKNLGLATKSILLKNAEGTFTPLDVAKLREHLQAIGQGLACNSDEVLKETLSNLFEGATIADLNQALLLAARTKIEIEPDYNYFTARLLLDQIYEEVLSERDHIRAFQRFIELGVEAGRLSPKMLEFNLNFLAQHLKPERDFLFQYIGLHLLYDRYFLQVSDKRIETPQFFWMRVAMGLAWNEADKEGQAIKFYDLLSQFHFVSSTPTLFNAGTCHPQLSSCFISTTHDDLDHIFKVISDNARMSKWAGGLGNDWTNVRAAGAIIKGTNGKTQGIVPFLKVANDTAVAVNQGGKRKGVVCAYLETWHLDIEDFLELRKNSGDERRRTHDMNTANWIPDLFMKRVRDHQTWTLFNPVEVPDLHDLYGKAFEEKYCEYEKKAAEGKIQQYKVVAAQELWRKMITMLFETGHPWITFKDPCNVRSPQQHCGVIHSSNLCTEITLNNSSDETAVCNLGSINLVAHFDAKGQLEESKLIRTVQTAMRMLDNVIDLNFYPTVENRKANLRHRPVGLGIMGFQDLLYLKKIPYESSLAAELSDWLMELISYHAISSSINLAKERGPYESFPGSLWSQGILPFDTLTRLENARGEPVDVSRTTRLDWDSLRSEVCKHGMRNSNTMAIAPTATIAHISGVSASIEPSYSHLYSRSNLSGEFICLNPYLVKELKALNLWDEEMREDLKYFDGSIQAIERIPHEIKQLFKTAFELDPQVLIDCAAERQKWIDMSQSLNLYIRSPSGRALNDLYFYAWKKGLKTTYYLRSQAATQIEKSTLDINKKGIQPRWMKSRSASSALAPVQMCHINDPECESCQ